MRLRACTELPESNSRVQFPAPTSGGLLLTACNSSSRGSGSLRPMRLPALTCSNPHTDRYKNKRNKSVFLSGSSVYLCVGVHMKLRGLCGGKFSPYTFMWGLGTRLGTPCGAASAFTQSSLWLFLYYYPLLLFLSCIFSVGCFPCISSWL